MLRMVILTMSDRQQMTVITQEVAVITSNSRCYGSLASYCRISSISGVAGTIAYSDGTFRALYSMLYSRN